LGKLPIVVANYLSQFHPIPENDEWWGKGYTEWSAVTAAKPLFPGHHQPQVPQGLGFYNLTNRSALVEQFELAKDYRVDCFMYYFYWFGGKRLLEQPIELRRNEKFGHKFFFCWANENWTRTWNGLDQEILLAQDSGSLPASHFILEALPFFSNEDYLKISGKPVVVIYRPGLIGDLESFLEEINLHTRNHTSFEGLHIIFTRTRSEKDWYPAKADDLISQGKAQGTHGFPPHGLSRERYVTHGDAEGFEGLMADYCVDVKLEIEKLDKQIYPPWHHPGVMPGFDNTARRGNKALIFRGANPYTFFRWFLAAVQSEFNSSKKFPMVFLNSWNEWAEGSQLEPSKKNGLSYLSAVRSAMEIVENKEIGRGT
jgi:hypothetical protein